MQSLTKIPEAMPLVEATGISLTASIVFLNYCTCVKTVASMGMYNGISDTGNLLSI
jgi:hypothetical protein